ncbi:MAG: NADH-quinone oxidoreductase subunit N [Acidobacteriota bacterium]|nr:NADH-quinone oxidoreductase subunit N [Acidobacteriota bacterium]
MPVNFMPSGQDYLRFLPEIIMTAMGTLIMGIQPILGDKNRNIYGHLTLVALLASIWATAVAATAPGTSFSNMLIVDTYGTFFRMLVLGVGLLTVLCSYQYLRREQAEAGEYHALILFSIVGQCVMVTANELIMVFIGLEISSIATYVLAGYLRDDKRNNEAALKYFLLGSFATAFLLYGIAWIYGTTRSTRLDEIRLVLLNHDIAPSGMLVGTAAALMFVGFAFKISVAPFQIWAPDVYQGSPAPVTAFMSAGPKAAAFAVFVRVYMTAFEPIHQRWEPFVWSSALLTMVIGNFAALTQTNIKRLLAYSSIAHAGYVMVAIAAHNQIGISAVMFYLSAYALMNVGAFAVIAHFSRQGEKYVNVEDLAGLGWKQPVTAALFSIYLLSFIGVPLTGGFFGKFYIFKAALDANLIWLAVIGLLNSAVAAYYYLRILVVMYFREPSDSMTTLAPAGAGIQTALWASALGTLFLGIFPSVVLNLARNASTLSK